MHNVFARLAFQLPSKNIKICNIAAESEQPQIGYTQLYVEILIFSF